VIMIRFGVVVAFVCIAAYVYFCVSPSWVQPSTGDGQTLRSLLSVPSRLLLLVRYRYSAFR
jgi:hypothetical protein